ncbi:5-formyltetrahydrofolate cyclo-ligase [Flavobacteriaceae bacterium UJ101]|nr:5-formyltetrahydrofolate cyclo-ligase [Flavobacteriaceae bacterium UJ101]
MEKSELRKQYKQKRKQLTEDEIRLRSLDLLRQLKETDVFENQVFHIFLPIEKRKEVFTWFFIEFLRMKGKTIVVSKCDFKTTTLEHFRLDKDTILKENHYGVPEPIEAKRVMPKELDVVFVPLLISDSNKYRVGYGKGFYDRFLAECREDVRTIGLNFFEPIDHITDVNSYDVSLSEVVFNSN